MGKKNKVHSIGKITVLQQVKACQEWQGNQRGLVHRDKTIYSRKVKHTKGDTYCEE